MPPSRTAFATTHSTSSSFPRPSLDATSADTDDVPSQANDKIRGFVAREHVFVRARNDAELLEVPQPHGIRKVEVRSQCSSGDTAAISEVLLVRDFA
eukprot:30694-Pelagococcus_subviridis.AAC.3